MRADHGESVVPGEALGLREEHVLHNLCTAQERAVESINCTSLIRSNHCRRVTPTLERAVEELTLERARV